jgi:hypothetical protein
MNVTLREKSIATYFGLTVKIVSLMRHCALISFGEREFVVDSEDLSPCAATMAQLAA